MDKRLVAMYVVLLVGSVACIAIMAYQQIQLLGAMDKARTLVQVQQLEHETAECIRRDSVSEPSEMVIRWDGSTFTLLECTSGEAHGGWHWHWVPFAMPSEGGNYENP